MASTKQSAPRSVSVCQFVCLFPAHNISLCHGPNQNGTTRRASSGQQRVSYQHRERFAAGLEECDFAQLEKRRPRTPSGITGLCAQREKNRFSSAFRRFVSVQDHTIQQGEGGHSGTRPVSRSRTGPRSEFFCQAGSQDPSLPGQHLLGNDKKSETHRRRNHPPQSPEPRKLGAFGERRRLASQHSAHGRSRKRGLPWKTWVGVGPVHDRCAESHRGKTHQCGVSFVGKACGDQNQRSKNLHNQAQDLCLTPPVPPVCSSRVFWEQPFLPRKRVHSLHPLVCKKWYILVLDCITLNKALSCFSKNHHTENHILVLVFNFKRILHTTHIFKPLPNRFLFL